MTARTFADLPPGAAAGAVRVALRGTKALGIAVCALAAGLALGWIGDRFGPALMLALPLGVLVAAAILARPMVGIVVVYATFPVGFFPLPTDPLQAAEIAVLLVIGAVILHRLMSGLTPLPWSAPMWWALLFLAWAFLATPSAVAMDTAVKQDAQVAGGILFALTVLAACRGLGEVRTSLMILLVVGAGMAAYGLREITSIRSLLGGAVVAGRAHGIFTHPNDLGGFAAIVFMVALGSALGARSRGGRWLSILSGAVCAFSLTMTLSRGAWVGTVLAGALMLYLLPQARRALMVVIVPIVLVTGIVIAAADPPDTPQVRAVRERLSRFLDPTANPYDERLSIYREAFREIGEDPWTGSGPGGFPRASAGAGSLTGIFGADHAHNVLLTVAAEIGVPAVAFLIGLTVAVGLVVFRASRRLPDPKDRALIVGVGAGLFVQVGQGLVDFNLRNPVISILMWSLVGMVLVVRREMETGSVQDETRTGPESR